MTDLSRLVNHQARLASRPRGLPVPENWSFTEEPVADPGEGGVVVQALMLSLDVLAERRGEEYLEAMRELLG